MEAVSVSGVACPGYPVPIDPIVKSSSVRVVARLLWLVPVALLSLAIYQAKVALDLRYTLENGIEAVAEVLEFQVNERVDIPFGFGSLRVPLPDGRELVREKMSLPYTLLPQIRYKETLDVRVYPDADQPIVIVEIARTQWKIAAIQALMSFVAFLLAGAGVYGWNRLLARKGDPATRSSNGLPSVGIRESDG